MRLSKLVLAVAAAACVAAPASSQNGILLASDHRTWPEDFGACMANARKTLLGAGMVIQTLPALVVASNEDRTIAIRCDIPGYVVFDEAFFPGETAWYDTIIQAFEARRASPLIPAEAKAHQYTVDCGRSASCKIDPAAVCRQAYDPGGSPAAKVLSETSCLDDQGPYTCVAVYDLNCN